MTSNSSSKLAIGLGTGLAIGAAAHLATVLADRRWRGRSAQLPQPSFAFEGTHHRLTSDDGGTVFAIESGEGPTFILGHGIAGDHTHWATVGRLLVASGFRVILFDQRGHGASLPGTDGYTLAGLAHDAAAVIEQLGGSGAVVAAGHSMGGVGLQALARFHPETLNRLDGLGLVATLPRNITGPLVAALLSPRLLRVVRATMQNPRRARVAMRGGFGAHFTTSMLDQLALTWATTADEALLGFGAALGSFSLLDDLGAVDVPTLVICGTSDAVTPFELSQEIDAALPDSNLVSVAQSGHMIVWEEPERLAKELASLHA